MTTFRHSELQGLIEKCQAPEARLPNTPPLSFTRNFIWVFATCGGILATVPLVAGWIAGLLLR